MACRAEWTRAARADLVGIVDYIADVLRSPGAASSFLDDLEACVSAIEANPFAFEAARDPLLRERGYRKVPLGNYVVLYSTGASGGDARGAYGVAGDAPVLIARIFYVRRDYAKLA